MKVKDMPRWHRERVERQLRVCPLAQHIRSKERRRLQSWDLRQAPKK